MPFCFHKCHYCDFYSIVDAPGSDNDRQSAFTDALLREFEHRAASIELRPRSVFVGGGTPTLLRVDLWDRLLRCFSHRGLLDRVGEFTIEANPETVTPALMQRLAAGGINRVSIGAQSFHESSLKQLERWHDPASVPRAVETVWAAGIMNVNLDLIFAIPGQTMTMLDADLDRALALTPEHLSCYSLIFEPNTPLTTKLKLGRVSRVGEETEREMYAHVMTRLDAAGYEHYEISNWARPGKRCEHNLHYWRDADWLGLGPSAASHVAGRRWKNEAHVGRYIAGSPTPPAADVEHLPTDRRIGEQLMLGLRLREGVAFDWLSAHLPADDLRRETIDELIELRMLETSKSHLRLTHAGLFVADAVIAKLL